MANTELKFKDKADTKTDESSKKNGGILARLKAVKNIEIYIAVFAVAAMLLIYFTSKTANANNTGTTGNTSQTIGYCEKMESRLETALSSIKDAGKAIVVVNWEFSVETIIAYTTNDSSTSSSKTPQIIQSNGSSQPIILKEIYPKALGVIVVCEGGDRPGVRMDVINAVSGLLAITTDKVSVYTMSKH